MTLDSANQARIHRAALQLFAERGGPEISISELAQRAGVARGTIYNNIESVDRLFEQVATELTHDMTTAIHLLIEDIQDPATRLGTGIKYFLKRSHDDPDWSRFLIRFGISNGTIKALWEGPVAKDVEDGIKAGRFSIHKDQVPVLMALIGGSVTACICLIRDGSKTWKDAGKDIVEMILRALGISAAEAKLLSGIELPRP